MGIISTVLGVFGFGIGISIGLVIGYFVFIYTQPTDVKVCFFSFISVYLVVFSLLRNSSFDKYMLIISLTLDSSLVTKVTCNLAALVM